jgi:hypothetical protein
MSARLPILGLHDACRSRFGSGSLLVESRVLANVLAHNVLRLRASGQAAEDTDVRVTIPHSKTKSEVIQAVDSAMQDVFHSMAIPPFTISHPQKTWNGSVMTFSLVAQMGFLRNTICGTVEVTDRDFTIDADLGLLNRIFPEQKVRTMIESRVRGLLTPPVKS